MEISNDPSSGGLANLFPCSTDSAENTQELGRRVSAFAVEGDVFALIGPVGSGKTQFVKGICAGLGVNRQNVTSPTFTLAHEYKGAINIVHIDLYRLESENDVVSIGFEDYLSSNALVLVEWPEIGADLLPLNTIVFSFEYLDDKKRRIQIVSPVGRQPSHYSAEDTGDV